jgi:hypothetical protein
MRTLDACVPLTRIPRSRVYTLQVFGTKIWSAVICLAMVAGAVLGSAAITADNAEAVPRKVKRACKSDYKTLCPRYRAGTSKMRSCMRSNGSQLSWRCYEALRDHGYVDGRRRRR